MMTGRLQRSVQTFFCLFFVAAAMGCAHTARAVELSPTRQTIVIDPGGESVVQVSLHNTDSEAVDVLPQIQGFHLDPENRPVFDDRAPVGWFQIPSSSVRIAPQTTRSITYHIRVPSEAEPGAHYIALFAAIVPKLGQVSVSTRVGSLLFLYVGGAVKEQMNIRDVSLEHVWWQSSPVQLRVTFENEGSIHIIPTGNIVFRDWQGNNIAQFPINEKQRKIFPATEWRAEYAFAPAIHWWNSGPVTVSIESNYGVTKQHATAEYTYWYVSPFLGVGGAFILFVAIFVPRIVRRKVRL